MRCIEIRISDPKYCYQGSTINNDILQACFARRNYAYFPRIGYLSDVRNKSFTISSEIQESIDMAAPSLDDVFQKFERQWIFDEDRGACVGIERTESCAYGVEGSNWTVWVTGGDIISDLDIWLYKRQHHI